MSFSDTTMTCSGLFWFLNFLFLHFVNKKEYLKIQKSRENRKSLIMLEMYKKVVFDNYANFEGRARRKEYWMFFLLNCIISFVINFILGLISLDMVKFGYIYSLGVFVPGIAAGVRRLHDINKSGWYLIIPIYNIVLLATDGDKGTNQYGGDPKNLFEEINEIGKE